MNDLLYLMRCFELLAFRQALTRQKLSVSWRPAAGVPLFRLENDTPSSRTPLGSGNSDSTSSWHRRSSTAWLAMAPSVLRLRVIC